MIAFYAPRRVSTPPKKHVVLLVEPASSFEPTNYRERPRLFRVIAEMTYDTLGAADSKRFRFNRTAMRQSSVGHRWTIKGGVK